MPQIDPWHAPDEEIHHDNSECVRGAGLTPGCRVQGDGGRPLCPICKRLDDAEASLHEAS